MATKTLIDKIEALPAEKQAVVERFVDALHVVDTRDSGRPGLVERLRVHREQLLRENGLFDSLPLIRELRENGFLAPCAAYSTVRSPRSGSCPRKAPTSPSAAS